MEAWARIMPQVQFLCVCVESKEVAIAFHRWFRFEHVVNGYIPSRGYMPVGYGQLGCSGFIVSDKDGYFVSKKTSAYLQYGDDAFEHVEQLLEELVPALAAPVNPPAPLSNSSAKKEKKVRFLKQKLTDTFFSFLQFYGE
jgi:hypothetical protein